jgi:GGDEF domain-containing protein
LLASAVTNSWYYCGIRHAGDAESLARRILDHLRMPQQLPGFGEVRVGASIGVALARPPTTAADLLRRADQANRTGRNQVAVAA